ncbi:MAG: TonB-dependent receptor [Sphingomonadales bacterium]|nr:TonB-dependent receptor [Sphingomonadales bacterium]
MTTLKQNVAWGSSTAILAIALCSAPAMAQVSPPRPPETATPASPPPPAPALPESSAPESDGADIVVDGLRASLADAISIRRSAEVILDGISSDDIGSTPDLNLGEALQRIQCADRPFGRTPQRLHQRARPARILCAHHADGADRRLPIAARQQRQLLRHFRCVDFQRCQCHQELHGGSSGWRLSANIDLRLTSALRRREGFTFRSELQYEESTQAYNPGLFGSFAFRLTDNFGIYANVSWSEQSFRRDEVSINSYAAFSAARAEQFGVAPTAADGTPQILLRPGEVRIQTREEIGDRLSASGGAEWEIFDGVSLRVDGIYTRRNLDEARIDLLRYNFTDIGTNLRAGDTSGQIIVQGGASGIIQAGTGQFGSNFNGNVFLAPVITSNNVPYFVDNRVQTGDDQAWAIYPQIEFNTGGWRGRLIGTISGASGGDTQVLFGARRQLVSNPTAAASRLLQSALTNGVSVTINTGSGNFNNFSFQSVLPTPLFDLTGRTFNLQGNRQTAVTVAIPGRPSNDFLLTGGSPSVDRDLWSIAGDLERDISFGPFTSVQIGARYDDERGVSENFQNAAFGANLGNLTDDIIRTHVGYARGATYFGGLIPGTLLDQRVFGLDLSRIITQLQAGGIAAPGSAGIGCVPNSATVNNCLVASNAVINPATGFYILPEDLATGAGLNTIRTSNFITDRTNTEAFALVRFNLEDWSGSGLPVRGNLGLRYVSAKLTGADTINNPAIPDVPSEGTYSAWLPSANLVWEFTDNLQFRAAYYHTFEAFDVTEFTPAPDFGAFTPGNVDPISGERTSPDDIDVNFSTIDARPRSSQAFDLVLSYYTGRTGLISIGYFNKSVSVNSRLELCPVGQSVTIPVFDAATNTFVDRSFGPVYVNPNDTNQCRIDALGTRRGELGDPNIDIFATVNVNERITVQGLEFQIQQDLNFLPGFLSNFGVVLNASRIWTESVNGVEFFNVADFFANAILYYEDEMFQGRLAYNYAGRTNLAEGGTFNGAGRTVEPRGQIDFSGAIRPVPGLEIRGEVFNITNVIRRDYQDFTALNRRASYDGRTYSIGVTYRF